MLRLLFPSKCILCRKLLPTRESDICKECQRAVPKFKKLKRKIPFIAHFTSLWYYKGSAKGSLLRFKFFGCPGYGKVYGKLLARMLREEEFDLLSWTPVSFLRQYRRGYDQAKLIAQAAAKELGIQAVPTLRKHRHTPPLSHTLDAAQRRAIVAGAYKVVSPSKIIGKRILLIDDVLTTGVTASECAKTLLIAGAKEILFATVAVAYEYQNK